MLSGVSVVNGRYYLHSCVCMKMQRMLVSLCIRLLPFSCTNVRTYSTYIHSQTLLQWTSGNPQD